jgi:hypothetical protein
MKCLASLRAATVAAAFSLLLPGSVGAQARLTGADVAGRVTDPSGAVLPGATVTITNVETNVGRTTHTDERGEFRAPALAPGVYRVLVKMDGFGPEHRDDVTVQLGESVALHVTLSIAQAQETVSVTAPSLPADRAKTANSSVIGQQQIGSLPTNGRNFIGFSVLAPGVTTDRTPQQGGTPTTGLSFAGQRARSNNIMVDGLDNNDSAIGAAGATFSQDAVREFQVLTNSYPAELGKATGGVVNIVTKSGTNATHGTAFGYYRDEALNAKDYFEKIDPFGERLERPKARFSQTQWGGTVGGPVRNDKTFYFVSLERADIAANNFVNIDPQAAAALGTAGFPVELGNVPYGVRTTAALAKIDHHFSPGSTLLVRANVSDHANENIEPFGGLVARSRGAAQFQDNWAIAGSHTQVFSARSVNDARIQVSGQTADLRSLDPRCSGACDDNFEGGPTIELPGIASVGRHRFTPQRRKDLRYQIADTVSLFAGRHIGKAGIDLNVFSNAQLSLPLHLGGRYIFTAQPANPVLGLDRPVSALEAFVLGLPAVYVQGYGQPSVSYPNTDVSLFVQDEWEVSERVTATLGVRFQKVFWPDVALDISNVAGSRLHYNFPEDNDNLAPRVAVAIDPFADGRTSLHAAYGVFHDHQLRGGLAGPPQVVDGKTHVRTLALRLPDATAAWNAPDHRLPEPETSYPCTQIAIDPDLQTPWAQHVSAGIDRTLGRDLSLSADVVFVRGRDQVATIDYNPIVPSLGPGRRPNDVDGRAGTSASVLQYTSYGESWYGGLTVSLNKRLSRRYQFLAAYTLSSAEDTTTDFQSGFPPQDAGLGRNPADPSGLPLGFDPAAERGPSTHDQRHRFVLSGLYQLPRGFELSGILTAGSGRPFTVLAGADLNGDGDGGGAFPADRARRDPGGPTTSVRRNSETMPAQLIVDARLTKRFRLRDGVALDAIAEAFNLFNRANFSEVNNIFGRGAFPTEPPRDGLGRVTYGRFEQALPPRQVQLAARFSF